MFANQCIRFTDAVMFLKKVGWRMSRGMWYGRGFERKRIFRMSSRGRVRIFGIFSFDAFVFGGLVSGAFGAERFSFSMIVPALSGSKTLDAGLLISSKFCCRMLVFGAFMIGVVASGLSVSVVFVLGTLGMVMVSYSSYYEIQLPIIKKSSLDSLTLYV